MIKRKEVILLLEKTRQAQEKELAALKKPLKPFNKSDAEDNTANGMLRINGAKLSLMGIENAELERDKLKDKMKAIEKAKKM